METSQAENQPSFAFAAALILVAAFFFVFAKDIPRTGLAGNSDPGPRALPMALALVVAAGGLIELFRAAKNRRRPGNDSESTGVPQSKPLVADEQPTSYKNFAVLTTAVFMYVLALSWLGFQISTVLFTSLVLIWLGARWWSAFLTSLAIVIVVRVLFVGLFHVQLPAGALGLAF